MEVATGVSYQFVHQSFSALGGLPLLQLMMDQLGFRSRIDPFLLHSKIATKTSSFEKFNALMLGFAAGCECLDDMEPLRDEALFSSHVKVNGLTPMVSILEALTRCILRGSTTGLLI